METKWGVSASQVLHQPDNSRGRKPYVQRLYDSIWVSDPDWTRLRTNRRSRNCDRFSERTRSRATDEVESLHVMKRAWEREENLTCLYTITVYLGASLGWTPRVTRYSKVSCADVKWLVL